ncbi:hypothetical protein JMJ77_0007594 [Colletotrichum scovillei]|uniref:Uncharacterized protein n=1 Tax=Colletotrichum scovillei TaxID=1209932 RepID=A0A9P7RCK5_9PEZI|nr:hypothetical protein JMJ77_0007594 [Colletotrichum scovillei]KAG7074606.1 hypothetical protein JMJ76_0011082 [Colletotrichum scovillei]KAG7081515.1 hypothetical protein JMJ78_0003634 [Colletotrichum scovillei]
MPSASQLFGGWGSHHETVNYGLTRVHIFSWIPFRRHGERPHMLVPN